MFYDSFVYCVVVRKGKAMATSWQRGSLIKVKRKNGPDLWRLRWRENGVQRSQELGSVNRYPTRKAALAAASNLRNPINANKEVVTFNDLCDKYLIETESDRATTRTSRAPLIRRLREQFGKMRLDAMLTDVNKIESWIVSLKREGGTEDLAQSSKGQHCVMLHRLIECAMRWNAIAVQANPIALIHVKGSSKRKKEIVTLTPEQYVALIADPKLPGHVRMIVILAMSLGLRVSEILGLRWTDIDFDAKTVAIRRSVVNRNVEETKTAASAQVLPLHDDLARELKAWKDSREVIEGWVFGSPVTGVPYGRDSLRTEHLLPAGRRIGVFGLGLHSLRHTHRAMLRTLQVPLEVQKTLMRHASLATTLRYGGNDVLDASRSANSQVVELLKGNKNS